MSEPDYAHPEAGTGTGGDTDRPDAPDIRAEDEHVYRVTLPTEDGEATEHQVTVPTELLDEWGLDLTHEPPLARAAVELLDRHHERLPSRFTITDASVAYDGFLDELRLAITG